jgi:hypothetical protein
MHKIRPLICDPEHYPEDAQYTHQQCQSTNGGVRCAKHAQHVGNHGSGDVRWYNAYSPSVSADTKENA